MKEKQNIENLFQERFEGFEVNPPEDAWENIEMRLNEKKNKRRIIPFWWKLSGIAALFVIGVFLITNKNTIVVHDNSVVIQDSLSNNKNTKENIVNDSNYENNNNLNPITSSDEIEKISETPLNTDIEKSKNGNNELMQNSENTKVFGTKNKNNSVAQSESNSSNTINQETEKVINAPKGTTKNEVQKEIKNPKEYIAQTSENNSSEVLKNNNSSKFDKKSSNEFVINEKNNSQSNDINKSNSLVNSLNNTSSDAKIASTNTNKDNANTTNIVNSATEKSTIIENNNTLKDSIIVAVVEPNALEELLKEKENPTKVVEQKLNRWQLSTNVAPIYFSSTGNGSPLDSEFENNSKTYNTSISYGMGVNYAVNKKIKIRTGVNRLTADYNTNDVVFFQNNNAAKIENVRTNLQGSVLQVESKLQTAASPELSPNNVELQKFDSSLNQRFGFLEVPVEMSYRIIDKKVGVDFIGGVSTLFLNENQVSINSNGLNMEIGEADNLNKIHFSGNLGIGIKYEFIKRFEARIEPIFKYQLRTFTNDDGNFRPYVLGIYSGISFTF